MLPSANSLKFQIALDGRRNTSFTVQWPLKTDLQLSDLYTCARTVPVFHWLDVGRPLSIGRIAEGSEASEETGFLLSGLHHILRFSNCCTVFKLISG